MQIHFRNLILWAHAQLVYVCVGDNQTDIACLRTTFRASKLIKYTFVSAHTIANAGTIVSNRRLSVVSYSLCSISGLCALSKCHFNDWINAHKPQQWSSLFWPGPILCTRFRARCVLHAPKATEYSCLGRHTAQIYLLPFIGHFYLTPLSPHSTISPLSTNNLAFLSRRMFSFNFFSLGFHSKNFATQPNIAENHGNFSILSAFAVRIESSPHLN